MNETQMLIGSLSNDLLRVANLTQRGSEKAAQRFSKESKRWAVSLLDKDIPEYLKRIARDVAASSNAVDIQKAERFLMYGILLQNYVANSIKGSSPLSLKLQKGTAKSQSKPDQH